MKTSISIQVNGQAHDLPAQTSVTDLLQHLSLLDRRVAVAVNQQLIPRSRHGTCFLHDGDHVEIVTAVGGG